MRRQKILDGLALIARANFAYVCVKKVSSYARCLSRREKGAPAFAFASICHFVGKRVLSHAYFFPSGTSVNVLLGEMHASASKK